MSKEYDQYIKDHKNYVTMAYEWLKKNMPELFEDVNLAAECESNIVWSHDESKRSKEEYDAYDAYFYGGNRSSEVVEQFNYAWLHHIHNNPHHWQHYVLINDDPNNGIKVLDMPDCYIIEMICDWWSFSFAKGDLYEILKWYDNHKKYMKLSKYTRNKVEDILVDINLKLTENEWNNVEN